MPVTKKQFKNRILQKQGAPSCKLRKGKPPIFPTGCVVRTLQKSDGKYHYFSKDGSSAMTKTFESSTKEILPHSYQVLTQIQPDGNVTIYAPPSRPQVMGTRQIPKVELKIMKNDGTEFLFDKLIDTGAPNKGLVLTKTEWNNLGFQTFDDLLIEAQNEAAADPASNRIHTVSGVGETVPTQLVRIVHPVYIKMKDGSYIQKKKMPVDIASKDNFVHSNIIGGFGLTKISKYYKT